MRRIPELRDLSEDHHHGLVLARKAKKAAALEDVNTSSEVWAQVVERFAAELEPHFQIEEKLIATQLAARGESELVKRLYAEHRALRACVAPGSGRSPEDLQRFGEMLEKHIRFEEREFFVVAQERLSPKALQSVGAACRARSAEE